MKYEDWIKYEEKRKKRAWGLFALLKNNQTITGKKKAPNREIVTSPKRPSLTDMFRRIFGSY
jgi:hypothetical protein